MKSKEELQQQDEPETITLPESIKDKIVSNIGELKTNFKDDLQTRDFLIKSICNIGDNIWIDTIMNFINDYYKDITEKYSDNFEEYPAYVTKVKNSIENLIYLSSGHDNLIAEEVTRLENNTGIEILNIHHLLGNLCKIEINNEYNNNDVNFIGDIEFSNF